MSSLGEATLIVLTSDERAELEGLARSTKTEHRTRFKARIVLMARTGRRRARSPGRWAARSARRRSGDEAFIVHLIFKYLETLEVALQIRSDTGVPSGR
jgi:hypothetical protein